MSLLWIICGAGRGVGKTTLALKLCDVLPNSHYVKCGHGRVKMDKPGVFLQTLPELKSYLDQSRDLYAHIVVESNALACRGEGDCIIFIDGIQGITRFRKDTELLRSKAHIRVSRHAAMVEWRKELSDRLRSGRLCRQICRHLAAQRQYLYGTVLSVRSKIWFESAGAHIFGMGLARLLKNVSCLGNLRDAAKASGMSYRYAWDLIAAAEDYLGKLLIESHAGGSGGGSSVLSAEGKHLMDIFERLNAKVARYSDACFARLWKERESK